jgi:DNA helicase-2/ATP-dependent DNA helicase PcrA
MQVIEDLFLGRYNKLNKEQQDAVDTIYGPVMVIAGPGTGKTEVLSMRIANLLRSEAQVQPAEILCLTYTDEATNSMRRRLLQIIGPSAHKINIYTFHGFCNTVIQQNPEYFSQRALQPITDLERTEVLYEMVEELPRGHTLRKLSGNIYFDVSRLNRLFDLMKREYLDADMISRAIDIYIEDLPSREKFIYKRNGKGFQKGDLKQAEYDDEVKRMTATKAAAALFDVYEAKMKALGRYDFNDMILWVLRAFQAEPGLLQNYQERFQFILVDEFQDTNGAQSQLLTVLTQFWEDPNLFVVGDDDQSIYEFQGARIKNIIEFYEQHKPTVKVIVLPQNYRSSQAILDKATASINNNQERLILQLNELNLNKNIVAANDRFADGADTIIPEISVYPNLLQEEAAIVSRIEALKNQGVGLHEVAVLYAQHKQAANLMELMERKDIPYTVKKPVNILEEPLIRQLLNVMQYLQAERQKAFSAEGLLFEMMHAPYYGISPTDIAMLSLYMQQKGLDKSHKYWRLILANGLLLESLNLPTATAMIRFGNSVENWLAQPSGLPLPLLIEKIVYESGMVAHLLKGADRIWDMQVLQTFFFFLKDLHDRQPKLTLADLLAMIDRMSDEGISIALQKVVQNDNGVRFYTAHGAKGNEFEHVFLIGCTKNFWEEKKGGGNEYKLPDTITLTDDDNSKTYKTEVARRLFYVALTRAKKHLYISYALQDNAGKELANSVFIDEISQPEERRKTTVSADLMMDHLAWAMTPVSAPRIELANRAWIEKALQNPQFALSYTNLSKFLRCPLTYYYECILKVPFLRGAALGFGIAIHNALERFFKDMKAAGGQFPPKEDLIKHFEMALFFESDSFTPLEYERRKEQGQTVLDVYYDRNINNWSRDIEIEYKVPRTLLDGVPVTGKIDKLEFDGTNCTVVDYKTGNPDNVGPHVAPPNDKQPMGGDYWRQMVFYKLLIEGQAEKNWKVLVGKFDYVEPSRKSGEYIQKIIPIFEQDEAIVRGQLKDAYGRIMNHDFDTGCGKEDCHWCNFARQYELVRPGKEEQFVELDDL